MSGMHETSTSVLQNPFSILCVVLHISIFSKSQTAKSQRTTGTHLPANDVQGAVEIAAVLPIEHCIGSCRWT